MEITSSFYTLYCINQSYHNGIVPIFSQTKRRPMKVDISTIKNTYNYQEYSTLVHELFEKGETTSGDNTEDMLDYTKLNMHRSARWDKRGKISEELAASLSQITKKMTWLVITEGWCGDAAQQLPYLNKIAVLNDKIDLKLILRDENPEIMDQFLTNGSRSIPKVIFIDDENNEVLAEWGPRPKLIQDQFLAKKNDPTYDQSKLKEEIHFFYAKDKGASLQAEINELIKSFID